MGFILSAVECRERCQGRGAGGVSTFSPFPPKYDMTETYPI